MVSFSLGDQSASSLRTRSHGTATKKGLANLLVLDILQFPGVEDVLLGKLPLAENTVFDFLEEGVVQHSRQLGLSSHVFILKLWGVSLQLRFLIGVVSGYITA